MQRLIISAILLVLSFCAHAGGYGFFDYLSDSFKSNETLAQQDCEFWAEPYESQCKEGIQYAKRYMNGLACQSRSIEHCYSDTMIACGYGQGNVNGNDERYLPCMSGVNNLLRREGIRVPDQDSIITNGVISLQGNRPRREGEYQAHGVEIRDGQRNEEGNGSQGSETTNPFSRFNYNIIPV